jgi:hypothetical protein
MNCHYCKERVPPKFWLEEEKMCMSCWMKRTLEREKETKEQLDQLLEACKASLKYIYGPHPYTSKGFEQDFTHVEFHRYLKEVIASVEREE